MPSLLNSFTSTTSVYLAKWNIDKQLHKYLIYNLKVQF